METREACATGRVRLKPRKKIARFERGAAQKTRRLTATKTPQQKIDHSTPAHRAAAQRAPPSGVSVRECKGCPDNTL